MTIQENVEEIIARYKTSTQHTAQTFGKNGYRTHTAQTLGKFLDSSYSSTERSLQRLHDLQPGSFDISSVLEDIRKYNTEQLTAYVKDTPNPPATTDTRKTSQKALDLIRGIRK